MRSVSRWFAAFLLLVVAFGSSPAWAATVNVSVVDGAFQPKTSQAKPGDTVSWNFSASNTANHTSTDSSGMGLWDSGSKAPGQTFTFVFSWAGSYAYRCTFHQEMVGTIRVPMQARPTSGTETTVFTIGWARAAAPAGYNFDVQIKRPQTTQFVDWMTNQTATSARFTPDGGPGVYQFQARLQNGVGSASSYSKPVSISVSA